MRTVFTPIACRASSVLSMSSCDRQYSSESALPIVVGASTILAVSIKSRVNGFRGSDTCCSVKVQSKAADTVTINRRRPTRRSALIKNAVMATSSATNPDQTGGVQQIDDIVIAAQVRDFSN